MSISLVRSAAELSFPINLVKYSSTVPTNVTDDRTGTGSSSSTAGSVEASLPSYLFWYYIVLDIKLPAINFRIKIDTLVH